MHRRVITKTVLFSLTILMLTGCSLNYGSLQTEDNNAPDFVFYNTTLTRVQNGKPRASIEARTIEQYESEDCLYGENLTFSLFSDKGDTTTRGTCALFSMDQNSQLYTFLDSVEITSYEQDVHITAGNLLWNNKTEQMTSDTTFPVTVTTGIADNDATTSTVISGTGLLIDGITRTYTLRGTVDGQVLESREESEE